MSGIEGLQASLADLQKEAVLAMQEASELAELTALKVRYLGKKGELTKVLKGVGRLDPAERPQLGKLSNAVKEVLATVLADCEQRLQAAASQRRIESERIDVGLPGRMALRGAKHPVQKGLDEICAIFTQMGFDIAEGPEIEDEFHNFDALNIPPEHPARAMHDTFFLQSDAEQAKLLRTHTSPVQIRTMLEGHPPLSIVAPGRVYRCDHDVTHSPMFHQVEVFKIDRHVSMAHLKGVLQYFLSSYFEKDLAIRLRPSYFPFTEPSAEVDVACVLCSAKGCRVCQHTGWLEVLGSGMVHPNVLRSVDIDPSEWSGFAFGLGVERLVMLKYGIPDLRLFFENDNRFIRRIGQ